MVLDRLKVLIKNLLADYGMEINVDDVSYDTTLMGELGLTSIMMLLIAIAMEQEFDIELTNMGSSTFVTVGDVCEFVEEAMKNK